MLFDLPVYPPSAMLERYPEAPIVVTVDPSANKRVIQDYLTEELNISRERIVNYEVYEKIRSCWHADHFAMLEENCWKLCCQVTINNQLPTIYFDKSDTPKVKVEKLIELRNNIKNALKTGESCACDGCPNIEMRWTREATQLIQFYPAFYKSICNLKCIYCGQPKMRESYSDFDADDVPPILQELKDENVIDGNTYFRFANGEISIIPGREKMLSMLNGTKTVILSNCVLYDEILAQHLKYGRSFLLCSLDAGTRETYKKIKGADKFDNVCANLKKYSQITDIQLKYIFLEGINDSDEDVSGFINFALELKPETVKMSKDFRAKTNYNNNTLKQSAKIISEMNKCGIKTQFSDSTYNKEEKEQIEFFVSELKQQMQGNSNV